jgi:hypothetical protein
VRAAALAAALVLALLGRGDVVALAGLLAVGAWRPLPALAVVSVLLSTAWRWSSTALEDIAGAQSVLGPAGLVDPPTAAAAAWLGAAALVLVTPLLGVEWPPASAAAVGLASRSRRWPGRVLRGLAPVAFGATAAVVVAGPTWGSDAAVRLVATIVAIALAALGASVRRTRVETPAEIAGAPPGLAGSAPGRRGRLAIEGAGGLAGVVALVLVGLDAPPAADLVDPDALVEGVLLALAVGLLAVAAGTVAHLHLSRGDQGPDGPTGGASR